MKSILVFGGNRYFGKKLVSLLISEGHNVTLVSRGKTEDSFGDKVKRITIDRKVDSEAWKQVENESYDIVYDNICYSPKEAELAEQYLAGRVKRYVFTSTMSVYDTKETALVEEDFNPYTYSLNMTDGTDYSYGEAKRQAECYFYQKSTLPVVSVRFPVVLGIDDYTKRLHWHIERIKAEKVIGLPNSTAKKGFITSDEAAKFLYFIGFESEWLEPINACSTGAWPLHKLIGMIENQVGKRAIVTSSPSETNHSPFGIADSWYMSNEKASELGFSFSSLEEWLPQLIELLSKE